jgi:superfamily II RNA helicase
MMADLEKLTKIKEVENSTLKMGYNEEDYFIRRTEYPNCIHDFIAPKNYQRPEKFVKPKEMAKQYKFTLDKFQEKAVESI